MAETLIVFMMLSPYGKPIMTFTLLAGLLMVVIGLRGMSERES